MVDAGPDTQRALAALRRLETDAGPEDPDYATAWPDGAFREVRVDGGRIEVRLGVDTVPDQITGQQAVHTVQGVLQSVAPVVFRGADGSWAEYRRDDRVVAPVNISDPVEGLVVAGVLPVRGRVAPHDPLRTVAWEPALRWHHRPGRYDARRRPHVVDGPRPRRPAPGPLRHQGLRRRPASRRRHADRHGPLTRRALPTGSLPCRPPPPYRCGAGARPPGRRAARRLRRRRRARSRGGQHQREPVGERTGAHAGGQAGRGPRLLRRRHAAGRPAVPGVHPGLRRGPARRRGGRGHQRRPGGPGLPHAVAERTPRRGEPYDDRDRRRRTGPGVAGPRRARRRSGHPGRAAGSSTRSRALPRSACRYGSPSAASPPRPCSASTPPRGSPHAPSPTSSPSSTSPSPPRAPRSAAPSPPPDGPGSAEATVPWTITDSTGKVVRKGFATAEGWVDRLYPFTTKIDLGDLAPGRYTFTAATDDPSDGEGDGPTEDTKRITVE
ncbi:hypothetical protein G5V59_26460 [Nocardioides sp. W3-2-3]|uniref:Gmad2 immunoglobulin-like domain-containing protein n=1 Tax=Nocardioides convexus TaxID=2712224 RepID=UPI0024186106|nr:Gmad2 immunoglobulin-like domain-containing protein [Nocardioides convexus]NHA01969.1 hypothetical protein [Nocardioides convexus]